jgi:hypothetical protein
LDADPTGSGEAVGEQAHAAEQARAQALQFGGHFYLPRRPCRAGRSSGGAISSLNRDPALNQLARFALNLQQGFSKAGAIKLGHSYLKPILPNSWRQK